MASPAQPIEDNGHGFAPQPVRGPVEQVRLHILDAILSGQLRPGDRLPSERELANGFRVGRAAVRDALRSLSQLDLIVTTQGRGGGSFVNRIESAPVEQSLKEAMELLLRFDAINLSELVDARRALEGTCVRLASQRRSTHDLDAMQSVLDNAIDPDLPIRAWLDLDIAFHRAVVRSANNRVLAVPLAALHALVQPRLNEAISRLLDRDEINRQHGAIHTAIGNQDPDAAAAAVDHHIDYLERLYRRSGLLPRRTAKPRPP
ncbi:MAG: FadR/GntR family transcriptional regulator [Acidimicrobiales bacterium]